MRREGRKKAKKASKGPQQGYIAREGGPQLGIAQLAASWRIGGGIGAVVGGELHLPSDDPFPPPEDCEGDSPCANFVVARKRRRMDPNRETYNKMLDRLNVCTRPEINFPNRKGERPAEVVSDDERVFDPTYQGSSSIFSSPPVTHVRHINDFLNSRYGQQAEVESDDETVLDPDHEETSPIFKTPPFSHDPWDTFPGADVARSPVLPPLYKFQHPRCHILSTPPPPEPLPVVSPTGSELLWWHNQPESPRDRKPMTPAPTLDELMATFDADLADANARRAATAGNASPVEDPPPSPLAQKRRAANGNGRRLPPAAPEIILIDPALLHIDTHLSQSADAMQNLREADDFLRTICDWDGSDKYEKPHESSPSPKKRKRE